MTVFLFGSAPSARFSFCLRCVVPLHGLTGIRRREVPTYDSPGESDEGYGPNEASFLPLPDPATSLRVSSARPTWRIVGRGMRSWIWVRGGCRQYF